MTTPLDPHTATPVAGVGAPLQLLATLGPSGAALQNATPTFLSYTFPNDGQLHRVVVIAALQVTSLQTGGAVGVGGTSPGGAVFASATQLFAGGLAAGTTPGGANRLVTSGSTFTVSESSAQTAGAAVLYCDIYGA